MKVMVDAKNCTEDHVHATTDALQFQHLVLREMVGPENGIDQASVISCDDITTVPREHLGRIIGYFLPSQELALSRAITAAFDLDGPTSDA